MSVTITKNDVGSRIMVCSPYHPAFPTRARQMDGKWDGHAGVWSFDARSEEAIRGLCREIYGTDGTEADLVTVRVTAKDWFEFRGPIVFAGRVIASARGRDTGAKTGEGVLLISGRARSGGSVKNWRTEITDGAVVEIRDLPRPAVEKELEKKTKLYIEILDPQIDRGALEAERARLVARISEIDAMMHI